MLRTAQDDQVSSLTTFNQGRDDGCLRRSAKPCPPSQALSTFRDYRAGPVKHPLFGLLMILLLSRIAGCRGWDATADWAEAPYDLFCRHLDLWKTPPGADRLRRTAQAYALEDFLDAMVAEGETVHIDGKRRRARWQGPSSRRSVVRRPGDRHGRDRCRRRGAGH